MATDNLTISMSPVLKEALSIPGETPSVDYYRFMGVKADSLNNAAVDAAVLDRTKELRRWQNSPQHGEEVVKLLPMLHRVAKILKDPTRRTAYAQELDRLRKGVQRDPIEDFTDMVRAAFVDGAVDNRSKAELLRYAEQNGIDQAEAGRILSEFSTATPPRSNLAEAKIQEFRIEKGGGAEFRRSLEALLGQGRLTRIAADKALAAAESFGITGDEAGKILLEVRRNHFRHLVDKVAAGGAISNNQARLLMPKADTLGLDADSAYEIISGFTYTGASRDELSTMSLVSAGFEASDIEDMLSKHETVVYQPRRRGAGELLLAGGKVGIAAVVLVGLIAGAYLGWNSFASSRQEPEATPTPTPVPTRKPDTAWHAPFPDPPSGFLTIEPLKAGDPPSFEVKIHEVNCKEYRSFLVGTLYQVRPPGWELDYSYPSGRDAYPVTGISVQDAKEYCRWRAKRLGLVPGQVRLPTPAEYRRMLDAANPQGLRPADAGFFDKVEPAASEPLPMMKTISDTLLFPGGQLYDVAMNVKEWAVDESGRVWIEGGSNSTAKPGIDLAKPISPADAEGNADVGFRIVVFPPRPNS